MAIDNLIKALARAFRWQQMLNEGVCGSIEELARREKVGRAYVSRMRLTLLAPESVEAIVDGRQPTEMQLDDLLEGFPVEWGDQKAPPRAHDMKLADLYRQLHLPSASPAF